MIVEIAVVRVEVAVLVFAVIVAVAAVAAVAVAAVAVAVAAAFCVNLVDTCCYYWKWVAEVFENYGWVKTDYIHFFVILILLNYRVQIQLDLMDFDSHLANN